MVPSLKNLGIENPRLIKLLIVAAPVAIAACGILVLLILHERAKVEQSLTDRLPALLPAPSPATQGQIITAMRAHPNPPLVIDTMLAIGADANGLGVLFSAMEPPESLENGSTRRKAVLPPRPGQGIDTTFLVIEVAGTPPRVIRRYVETYYNPAY
jgi:hypothetical protein